MAKIDKSVNLAVVGAGYWGRKVTSEYLQLSKQDPDFRLVKVCDLLDENLLYCKEKLGINKEALSADLYEVLNSKDIDAIHFCTPNETHFSLGCKALKAGKNVLMEKPMSLTTHDAWDLVNVATSRNLTLQVGHIYRFNNALKKIKELIDQGYLGQLYYLKMEWTTLMPCQFNRDIIFDLGPHPVDIMNYLLDSWPQQVFCSSKGYRNGSREEVAYITLDFGNNILSHVELSWLQPGKTRELIIVGSKKTARVDCVGQRITIFEDNDNYFPVEVEANNTIFDETRHFVNSIRDENNHKNPGPIGAGNVAVLESLKASLIKGKFMKVDPK
jgi:predicted dehydrogenase